MSNINEIELKIILEEFHYLGYKIYEFEDKSITMGSRAFKCISSKNDIMFGADINTGEYACINNATGESFSTFSYLDLIKYLKKVHKSSFKWILTGKA